MNEQIAKSLDLIAAKLGVGAEVLWAALLKQAPIDSACSLLLAGLTVIGGYFYFKKLLPWAAEMDELHHVAGAVLGGIALLATSITLLFSLDMILAGFLNPDYWALKQLLGAIKAR